MSHAGTAAALTLVGPPPHLQAAHAYAGRHKAAV